MVTPIAFTIPARNKKIKLIAENLCNEGFSFFDFSHIISLLLYF